MKHGVHRNLGALLFVLLACCGAYAETVTLQVEVDPHLSVEISEARINARLDGTETEGTHVATLPFRVRANIDHTVQVRFATWQDHPAGPIFAAFSNGNVIVAGQLRLEWLEGAFGPSAPILSVDNGVLRTRNEPGVSNWMLHAVLYPSITNAPTGLAPSGTYSLDVEINLQPH